MQNKTNLVSCLRTKEYFAAFLQQRAGRVQRKLGILNLKNPTVAVELLKFIKAMHAAFGGELWFRTGDGGPKSDPLCYKDDEEILQPFEKDYDSPYQILSFMDDLTGFLEHMRQQSQGERGQNVSLDENASSQNQSKI
jgi:hypothetical protein